MCPAPLRRPVTPAPEGPDGPERAVSEVLGGILMTALVVVAMTVAASAVVPQFGEDADTGRPLVDCETSYEEGLLQVTHAGG
jgi:FlaG/FlaF family flagellin (archaellin)